jgi:hypothetical protein
MQPRVALRVVEAPHGPKHADSLSDSSVRGPGCLQRLPALSELRSRADPVPFGMLGNFLGGLFATGTIHLLTSVIRPARIGKRAWLAASGKR